MRLGLSLASKEVEEVEAGGGLAEDSGLDTEGVVGSVELDSSELGGLDVTAELGGGHVLPVLLADPEPGLEAGADAVSVTIVDSASNKSSEAAVYIAAMVSLVMLTIFTIVTIIYRMRKDRKTIEEVNTFNASKAFLISPEDFLYDNQHEKYRFF